ncbi:helix-turn-helix domain-containing protein (plasmid) [Tistrella mobilis]|uniref:helix-turn-helix domain-containing protein n=1 Tax=Tistrella mobilis TaxID=171437 RepID=UPI003558A02E
MDALITAAARALAADDLLGALNRVALRDDPPALALRGIVMARLGEFGRARDLLARAGRGFGRSNPAARARCILADAEIALVLRDIAWPQGLLDRTRAVLETAGDHANAAHARIIEARRLLLIGRPGAADALIAGLDPGRITPALAAGLHLTRAGIAARRIAAREAAAELDAAAAAAEASGIAALAAEVAIARRQLDAPAARLVRAGTDRLVTLAEVEALPAQTALIVDACRLIIRDATDARPLATRPVLFALARQLALAHPADVPRAVLIREGFGGRSADDSHRARLRVEIGRLRRLLHPLARIRATATGFVLETPRAGPVALLDPPVAAPGGRVLALLADGEAWSTAALATALGTSPRTVQRLMERLAADGHARPTGRGRARRWTAPALGGFPTIMLLPGV